MTVLTAPYQGARRCTGGPRPGALALMSWFLGEYRSLGGRNLGIYNCRPVRGGATWSLHSEGRAADLGVSVGASWAGDLAQWIVANSAELGVQCVIYARRIWSCSLASHGWRPYTGVNPHTDHLHVELTPTAAVSLTVERIVETRAGLDHSPDTAAAGGEVRLGSNGDDVARLQTILRTRYPLYAKNLVSDGVFGPRTLAAVKEFQRRSGLVVDGIVGPLTWAALG